MLTIPALLSATDVQAARRLLERGPWVDGRVTAGHQSAQVKDNLQIPEGCAVHQELGALVLGALQRDPIFIAAVLPQRIFPPLFNRYEPGMGFGAHVDNAIRQVTGTPHRIRTDVSCTLFLADPGEYDGGELVIGETAVKLPAGDAVVYPATSLHSVAPVTRGSRLASFFWVQSMVRDAGQRRLLFDLDMAIDQARRGLPAGHAAPTALTSIYHNLLRRWADA